MGMAAAPSGTKVIVTRDSASSALMEVLFSHSTHFPPHATPHFFPCITESCLQELEEEKGHVCVVCGEGETYRPGEPLGAYVYVKRVPLGLGDAGRLEYGYTTVSHFNLIHFGCHREASIAERNLKQPKEEWEGATLRNSSTRCNAMLPLMGSTVSDEAYAAAVEQFWAACALHGRTDLPRSRLLLTDLKLLLLRLAHQLSFSADARGGSKLSNLSLIPSMALMLTRTLDANGEAQRRAMTRALASWLAGVEGGGGAGSGGGAESGAESGGGGGGGGGGGADGGADSGRGVYYKLTLSLVLHSLDEWKAHRMGFLRALLRAAPACDIRELAPIKQGSSAKASPMLGASPMLPPRSPMFSPRLSGASRPGSGAASRSGGPSPSLPPLDPTALEGSVAIEEADTGERATPAATPGAAPADETSFIAARPALIFLALVNRLQHVLKAPRSYQPAADDESSHGRLEKRLRHHDRAVLTEISELLNEYENELLHLESWLEAFEVLEVLADVLGEAPDADAWVKQVRGE